MSNDQHTPQQPDNGANHPYYGDKPQPGQSSGPVWPPSNHYAPQPAARRAGKTTRLNELKATATRKPWIILAGIAALALLLGISIGAAQPPRTVEVTKTVEKPVDRIVEKRVEVPTTPKECVAALGYAQDVITSAGTTIGYMSDGFKAAARLDAAGVQAMSPKVDAQTEVIRGLTPKFQSNRDSCLASAK